MSSPTYTELKIFYNGADFGFSEIYALRAAGFTASESAALTLIDARRRLLASGINIVHAVLSDKATKGDSLVVQGYTSGNILLDAEDTAGTDDVMNDPQVGLLMRFDTGDGKFANRLIRGIRDSWVEDNKKTMDLGTDYAVGGPYLTYAVDPALDTSEDVIGNYCAIVRDYTYLVRPSGNTLNPYDLNIFALWQYRRVGAHQVGKRFGASKGRQPAYS